MLILSRKSRQRTTLTLTKPLPAGSVIEITQVDVSDTISRIGIQADKSIVILRDDAGPLQRTTEEPTAA